MRHNAQSAFSILEISILETARLSYAVRHNAQSAFSESISILETAKVAAFVPHPYPIREVKVAKSISILETAKVAAAWSLLLGAVRGYGCVCERLGILGTLTVPEAPQRL